MLLVGVLLAGIAPWIYGRLTVYPWRGGIIAMVLALAVLAYDGYLKKTALGPIGMGLCRLLNVLLGMSVTQIEIPPDEAFLTYHTSSWIVAGGIGLYITGVTWFARSEATQSNWWQLLLATVVIAGGITLLPLFTLWPHPEQPLPRDPKLPFLLFAVLSLPMLRRAVVAITDPEPMNVQAMVKHCIMSLIVLDAAVTVFASGPMQGLLIAALIAPTLLLGRWVYST
jgi:4-hydroxybenzoate polyprenyltransferase